MLFDILFHMGVYGGLLGMAPLVLASMTGKDAFRRRKQLNVAGLAMITLAAVVLDVAAVIKMSQTEFGLGIIPPGFGAVVLSLFAVAMAATTWMMIRRPARLHPPHFSEV